METENLDENLTGLFCCQLSRGQCLKEPLRVDLEFHASTLIPDGMLTYSIPIFGDWCWTLVCPVPVSGDTQETLDIHRTKKKKCSQALYYTLSRAAGEAVICLQQTKATGICKQSVPITDHPSSIKRLYGVISSS